MCTKSQKNTHKLKYKLLKFKEVYVEAILLNKNGRKKYSGMESIKKERIKFLHAKHNLLQFPLQTQQRLSNIIGRLIIITHIPK